MEIICPECGFSKDLPSEQMPQKTVIAKCPKCGCRFRFVIPTETVEDDPLPPGAVVKEQSSEVPETETTASNEEENKKKNQKMLNLNLLNIGTGNPWSRAPGRVGWAISFYQTIMRVMFAAPRFFSALSNEDNQQKRALLFYTLVCLLQTGIERIWGMIFLATVDTSADPQLAGLLAMFTPQFNVLLSILLRTGLLIVQLYLFSGLMYLVYRLIDQERSNFNLTLQILAYSAAPGLLCIVPLLGSLTGTIWSIVCIALGIKQYFSFTWAQTLAGFIPIMLLVAFSLRGLTMLAM